MITPIIPTTVPPTSAIPKAPPIPNKIIPNICIFIHLSFCNMLIKGLQPVGLQAQLYRREGADLRCPLFLYENGIPVTASPFLSQRNILLYHFIPSEDFYFHFSYRNFHTERNLFLPKEVCVIRNYAYISPLIRPADVYM